MKANVSKTNLLDALQKVASIIGARSTLPILGNVLIEASNDKLTFTTTDLEIRIKTEVEAKVSQPGKTTLPAKRLLNIIRELPGNEIDLMTDESHHTKIVAGKTSSFKLHGLASDDFPQQVEFSALRKLSFKQSELARSLNLILYAVSNDDTRKVLNGVLFSMKEGAFTAVATDGKRLALVEKTVEDYKGEEGDSIIPSKSANELTRLLGKEGSVSVEIGDNQAIFRMEKTEMYTKLVEGNYPNYKQVIPTSFSKNVQLPVESFASALRRVSLVVSDSSSCVKLKFAPSELTLSAVSTDIGESKETIGVEYGYAEMAISFNPVYLADPFKTMDSDKITMQMNDAYGPVALSSGDGFLYVIMPMRNK